MCVARLSFGYELYFFDNRILHLFSVLPHLGRGVLVLSCSTLAGATIPIIHSLSKHLILSTFFSYSCDDASHASMLPPKHFFSPHGNISPPLPTVGVFVCHQQNVKLGAHVRIFVGVREASEVIEQESSGTTLTPIARSRVVPKRTTLPLASRDSVLG